MIRILICDDHQLVIDGLQLMLHQVPDMTCVGTAKNGREALDLLSSIDTDVLLLDINMPEMDGLECCKLVHEHYPKVKVLILSMMAEISLVKNILKQGASGFLLKNAGKDELIEAIRSVYDGKSAFSESLLEILLSPVSPQQVRQKNSPFPSISRREKQILQLIVDEKTTSEIGEALFISFGTVETHRRSLLLKLNARNTAGLVRSALEYDLLK
jgi:DNA-binding NarL/FixJ family response regulator